MATKTPAFVIRKIPTTAAEWQYIINGLNDIVQKAAKNLAAFLAHEKAANAHAEAFEAHNADATAHAALFAAKQDALPDKAGSANMVLAVNPAEDGFYYVPNGGGEGGITDHGLLTGLSDDDHAQYHNDARGDARYDTLGAATAAVSSHVGASDPHPQYLTQAEGDARYTSGSGGAFGYSEPVVSDSQLIFSNDGDIVMCIITEGIAYGST